MDPNDILSNPDEEPIDTAQEVLEDDKVPDPEADDGSLI